MFLKKSQSKKILIPKIIDRPLVLFKRIEIDIESIRNRINKKGLYNKRQCKSLNTLLDLFVCGDFQGCLDYVNDDKSFPYNTKKGYSEREHIDMSISDVLHDVFDCNYYTKDELLLQAKLYVGLH